MSKILLSFIGVVITLASVLFFGFHSTIRANSACEQTCTKDEADQTAYLSCVNAKKTCLEETLRTIQSQKVTLSNTIALINGRVAIQELQIQRTEAELIRLEREVLELSDRINGLNVSLDRLSEMLVERIQHQYKALRNSSLASALQADTLAQAVVRSSYVKETGERTADAMERAESQRIEYDAQKSIKEEKQAEVEQKQAQLQSEQQVLTKQRAEQQFLFSETKNNEQKFQELLAKTLAEIDAIQSIIAGKGTETNGGEVQEGNRIASIIQGASTCSTGTHLHFEVVKDKINRDPAGYLKNVSVTWNNSPDGAFGLGGDWIWPVNDPVRITQGYGMTYYARVRRAYGGAPHTGIDMVSLGGDATVKAVKSGTLYRGSIKCGNGQLRYVKVDHNDGYSTYYLHVNY